MILSDALTSDLIIPLLSISGLLMGVILSRLAREELSAGKKYFVLLYRIFFLLLSLIITYFLSFPIILFFFFFALVLLLLDLKKSYRSQFYLHYLLFIVGYFLSGKQIIVAVFIFLYSLPVGTILGMKKIRRSLNHE